MDTLAKPQQRTLYFPEERKRKILEMLNEQKKIVVPDLCKYFNISPATIRNDLHELEQSGLLKRTHGGAILNQRVKQEKQFVSEVEHLAEKKAIAAEALTLIEDGDALALDTGTTTMELAKLLGAKRNLTIVVNDIQLALLLEANTEATVVLVGGILRKGMHCTVGPMATEDMKTITVDKAFIATNGLTLKGLSTPDMHQGETKTTMISIANEVILLTDSSKLGTNSFSTFATPDDIDRLIIDDKADPSTLNALSDCGISITVVSV